MTITQSRDAEFKPGPPGRAGVTVVVTVFDDAHFLDGALRSLAAQTREPDEIIVVDDGSHPERMPNLADWPGVKLVRKANGGLSSARNVGLAEAQGAFILFLDVDDRLAPGGLENALACLAQHPDAAFCYGAHRRIDAAGAEIGGLIYNPVGSDPHADLLRGNLIGMHATVLYRADVLRAIGGFDETLKLGEDYDLYLRLSARHAIMSHPGHVADYHWHGANVSGRHGEMLNAILAIHARHKPDRQDRLAVWRDGRRAWRRYYLGQLYFEFRRDPRRWAQAYAASALDTVRKDPVAAVGLTARWARRVLRTRMGLSPGPWPPAVGQVRFGDFASTTPVSRDFGFDRGLPVDRFYIEAFLARHAASIAGRVLEIGDDAYSRRFGGDRIARQDVLHVSANAPGVTIVGDLSQAHVLPPDAFDCIVLTQTLHIIFDVRAALRHLHAALKPGGVLLMTTPGISPIDRGEWGDDWYWSFTRASTKRLLHEVFEAGNVETDVYGNVFAAVSFLHGLCVAELDAAKLAPHDPAFPVIIATSARRSESR